MSTNISTSPNIPRFDSEKPEAFVNALKQQLRTIQQAVAELQKDVSELKGKQ